jgi:hypothetical protein
MEKMPRMIKAIAATIYHPLALFMMAGPRHP